MTISRRRNISLAGTVLALIAFLFFFYLKEKEKMKIENLPKKTLYLGRFILDIPRKSIVTYGGARVSGWAIDGISESVEDFSESLFVLENQLKKEKDRDGDPIFDSKRPVEIGDLHGIIFLYNRDRMKFFHKEKNEEIVSIKAVVRLGEYSYVVSRDYSSRSNVDDLLSLLNKLRNFKEKDALNSTGFCFGVGMMLDPLSASQSEFTVAFIGFPDHPDIAMAFSSSAGLKPFETLLQRDAKNDVKAEHPFAFRTLRAGRRDIGGVPGEEVLDRLRELSGRLSHGFMWESFGTEDDVYVPKLILELDTGKGRPGEPVSSSLSNSEALALWDQISSTIRRRPVAEAQPAK